jgi:hypothetical protein
MSNFFWNNYDSIENVGSYQDGADNMGQAGYSIGFHHIISGINIYFKAFITEYNETFDSDWAAETVYGRADPIYTFKSTTRNLSLGFKIPAASTSEGYENLAKVQQLAQFLYPAYEFVGSAQTIAQGPLIRLKMMNLIQASPPSQDPSSAPGDLLGNYSAAGGATAGLLGIIKSLTINHNLGGDEGVLDLRAGELAGATILPKVIDVNIAFSPIHETPLGWQQITDSTEEGENQSTIQFSSQNYPYGAVLASSLAAPGQPASGDEQAAEDEQAAAGAAALNPTGN